ncbi:hypothetical protein QBC47DRAFT_290914 [Echria macrotheca]|uniref:Uncharacterized protein n=1 Tax=Echria macrotheca TaxID=438768 RepID=A0AAJ0FE71_9PEZI|nr:hypothetical protein QBC47DRAFT_290914 [Echria macrotheca]
MNLKLCSQAIQVEVYSFVALIQLLTKTPLPILKVACIVWLLLNFSIQTAISAIGLTFKAEPSIQDIYLDSTLGNVTIPDMSRFARVGRFFDSGRPQSIAAHMLGDSGADFAYSTLPSNSLAGTPVAQNPYEYWDAGGHWEFIFATSAPGAASAQDFNFLSVYSNQSVRSTATCRTPSYTFNDSSATLEIRTENQTILFPGEPLADEAMTYLTEPILSQNPDKPITTGICGPGCSTVHVLEPMTAQPVEDPESAFQPGSYFYYYQCNVTLTPVGGDDNHAGMFNLTPTAAAVAAQAIALSGARPPGPTANTTGTGMYTAYTLGLEFGQAQSNNATGMARMLSRFAIGVVAAAARTNPRMVVGGYPPRQGVRLVLDKPVAFGGILVATAVVQLGLLIGAVVAVLSGTGGKGDGNDGITRKREWDW